MTFSFTFHPSGCEDTLFAGTEIEVGYRLNQGSPTTEILILENDVASGDVIEYTFDQGADFVISDDYKVDFWASLDSDAFAINDTIFNYPVTKVLEIDTVYFNNFDRGVSPTIDFYTDQREHSRVFRTTGASNSRPFGYNFTALDTNRDGINIPSNPDQNFEFNQDYISRMCFCVDASEWIDVVLTFDLRQVHSAVYNRPNFTSNLRVTVAGEPVSEQFHPTTFEDDPWDNKLVDLIDYAGSEFELCFEGQHFITTAADNRDTRGDNSYLDNVNIRMTNRGVSTNDIDYSSDISIFPNPAKDILNITSKITEKCEISLINSTGQIIRRVQSNGVNRLLDISDLSSGLYIIQIRLENGGGMTEKVIIQ